MPQQQRSHGGFFLHQEELVSLFISKARLSLGVALHSLDLGTASTRPAPDPPVPECRSALAQDKWTHLGAGLRDFSLGSHPAGDTGTGIELAAACGGSQSLRYSITLPLPGSPQIQPPANPEPPLLPSIFML